jgi:hypothetical protein
MTVPTDSWKVAQYGIKLAIFWKVKDIRVTTQNSLLQTDDEIVQAIKRLQDAKQKV